MSRMLEAARVEALKRARRYAQAAREAADDDSSAVFALLAIEAQLDRLATEYERRQEDDS
jgi:hypothetical protein